MKARIILALLCATVISTCTLIKESYAAEPETAPNLNQRHTACSAIARYPTGRTDPFSRRVAEVAHYLDEANEVNPVFETLLAWSDFINAVQTGNIDFNFSNPSESRNPPVFAAPAGLTADELGARARNIPVPTAEQLRAYSYSDQDHVQHTGFYGLMTAVIVGLEETINIGGRNWDIRNIADPLSTTLTRVGQRADNLPNNITIHSHTEPTRYDAADDHWTIITFYEVRPPATGWNVNPANAASRYTPYQFRLAHTVPLAELAAQNQGRARQQTADPQARQEADRLRQEQERQQARQAEQARREAADRLRQEQARQQEYQWARQPAAETHAARIERAREWLRREHPSRANNNISSGDDINLLLQRVNELGFR